MEKNKTEVIENEIITVESREKGSCNISTQRVDSNLSYKIIIY